MSFEKTWQAVVNHCVELDWPTNTNMKRSRYLQTKAPLKTSLMILCKTPFITDAEAKCIIPTGYGRKPICEQTHVILALPYAVRIARLP